MLALAAVKARLASDVEISVIVPSYNASATIARSLAALRGQQTSAAHEVIVVDSGSDDSARLVETLYPEVRLLRCGERVFPGHARNLAVTEARGAILAFVDADCIAAPDWIEAIRIAHRAPPPVIGGVVANGNPESVVGRAYYFTEFNRWLPENAAGFVDDVPGCCWSMKRAAYERYGPFLQGTYCSDTVFHWRMAADGLRPFLDPTIRVAHLSPTDWRVCLSHEPFHGRSFARVRVAERDFSRRRALLHAVTAPALPFLLFARACRNVAASRVHARSFLAAAPLVFLAMSGWSWGEMTGYAAAAARA